MPRTTAHRAALAAALVTPLLLPLWAAGPARAHGAPTDPVSRVVACSPEGGDRAGSAACRAAVAANGAPFTAWDNLRVANVGGRDRQVVPDGKLCSGGLPGYKGLDLARADWPATRMTPGGTLTMRYVSTIPHTGTFRMYLTKPGYDPTGPLSWADLPEKPFAEVTDPALKDGAYRLEATLPSDRTGRHVLYTVWQNSSTPDTYYSCSDVVFPAEPEKKDPEKPKTNEGESAPVASPSGSPAERSTEVALGGLPRRSRVRTPLRPVHPHAGGRRRRGAGAHRRRRPGGTAASALNRRSAAVS
ncbi:lytic polysaccharide monooxygenase auxiliary activity family 9 protein [Streptomyces afghaniensis]|uniref:lytic polysaccharide monooxygenase auxiliary activity family 9 protein n=1 Tax=Streptomyces afghaniensis TaxID=66865 RepID=UPI00278A444A|nr:putative carbohydrate-binding protein with CBM5 and CBM33 domain [Streptomyces afghaniensis]